jgi:GDPmannose 4,6-dehydratase
LKKKIALITGINGQDGSYLAEYLLKNNYIIHGVIRRASTINTKRLDAIYENPLKKNKKLILHYGDLTDTSFVNNIIDEILPDEIYNLAAQSHVKVSFDTPEYTSNVNALGPLRILEKIKNVKNKKIKLYQASTSEMFGNTKSNSQNEKTIFDPRSPYALSKVLAHYNIGMYRDAYKIFACSGILFNHESPRRGETFVTRKITIGIKNLINKKQKYISLGNLYSYRDWGHAKEYCEIIHKIMQQKKPEDYVIATGKAYSVKDFVIEAFKYIGISLSWKGKGITETAFISKTNKKFKNLKLNQTVIKINKKYFRPLEVDYLKGDPSKAKKALKWKNKITFKKLVQEMVESEIKN